MWKVSQYFCLKYDIFMISQGFWSESFDIIFSPLHPKSHGYTCDFYKKVFTHKRCGNMNDMHST